MRRTLLKSDIPEAATPGNEVLLLRIVDGSIYLCHVEAEIYNDQGEKIGSIVLNDEVKLPFRKFRFKEE